MENLVNCLLLQLILLQLPFFYWDSSTGGIILGHLKYLQDLIKDMADLCKRLEMVFPSRVVYDKDGEIIKPELTINIATRASNPPSIFNHVVSYVDVFLYLVVTENRKTKLFL